MKKKRGSSEDLRKVLDQTVGATAFDVDKLFEIRRTVIDNQPILIGAFDECREVASGRLNDFIIRKGKEPSGFRGIEISTDPYDAYYEAYCFLDFPLQPSQLVADLPYCGSRTKPFRLSWSSYDIYLEIYSEEKKLVIEREGLEILLGRTEIERRLFESQRSMTEDQTCSLMKRYLMEMEKIDLEPTQKIREIVAKSMFAGFCELGEKYWSSSLLLNLEEYLKAGLHKGDYVVEVLQPGIIIHPPKLLRAAAENKDSWRKPDSFGRSIKEERNLIATYFTNYTTKIEDD